MVMLTSNIAKSMITTSQKTDFGVLLAIMWTGLVFFYSNQKLSAALRREKLTQAQFNMERPD
jgi:hypothetical protein